MVFFLKIGKYLSGSLVFIRTINMSENPETSKLIQQCTMVKQVIEDSMKWVQTNVEKDKQAVTIYNLKKLRRDAKRYRT